METRKFKIFLTTNDVDSFGRSYTISKFFLYSTISIISFVFLLSLFGIYFLFLSEPKSNMPVEISKDDAVIKFIKDPVEPKNGSDFETSFITSNFENNHKGIDINGSIGTKIYSPMEGIVIYAGYDKKFGNSIIISHDNGCITKYMHNKSNLVKSGERIDIKKPIAEMGNSGSSVKNEGIHLHFELWKDGEVINPSGYIKNLKTVDIDTYVSN
tara:strand:- start:1525 stop:2163 length:639 start_codon:yes stop_codon:yes gene_type:complete